MIYVFDFKIIKSGKEVEVYEYKTKDMVRGYKKLKIEKKVRKKVLRQDQIEQLDMYRFKKELQEQEEQQKKKTDFSMHRTRSSIRRLANSNPQLDKFLTLTFAESTTDLKEANRLFHLAMKRIIHIKPDFAYISVVEFQKDVDYQGNRKENGGSVHYHLICNIRTIIKRDRFEWERWFQKRYWKYGFVKVKDITQVDNMGAYFCKYLGKDMFDKRMFGKKKFFCSRNLNQPIELTGPKARMFFNNFVINLPLKFETIFENKWAGKVRYTSYTLKPNLPINK
ncbi:MAG: hypothetical protein CO137_02210 [Candidatus Magasanikbacteria bacterium CG_4_9_14_3_um_filter_32_9]|uniref:Replication-associated protein ORF2/G2P domain-containing protein n=1 Tax=Candidatus Magasanikbacteria bacterium CG_4_9_14_3_um_filter_32_9 TaxID=1974644 RepID=A0A2M7Z6R6_9BACT|nr:MAG: hypothetical protein CO137_02210 [Candidatus Magasanikbacteria bacterium CG_4_9_14_3_um_filter_32_9]